MQRKLGWQGWVIKQLGWFANFLLRLRGRVQRIMNRMLEVHQPELTQLPFYSPYYFHRKSQLERLPKTSNIIFLGDSLTTEGEWSELLGVAVSNRGISGDTTYGVLQRLDGILENHPPEIFLMIGTNDLERRLDLAILLDNYRGILQRCHGALPETTVYVQSILPVAHRSDYLHKNQAIATVNHQLAALAQEFGYPFIDLHPHFLRPTGHTGRPELDPQYSQDGVHLNGLAYERWASLIQQYVAR